LKVAQFEFRKEVRTVSLDQYSKEDLLQLSLIEVAYELLKEKKQSMAFNELINEVAKLLEMPEDEMKSRMSQFYTDLNIDGRFISLGGNTWGLRAWYPVEHVEEEVVAPVKPKKKAKKAVDDDDLDLDIDDYDDVDEDDLDFDDLDDYEDDEELIDDDEEDLLDTDDEDDFDDVDDEEEFDLDEEEDDTLDLDLDVDEDLEEEEED